MRNDTQDSSLREEDLPPGTLVVISKPPEEVMKAMGESHWSDELAPFCSGNWKATVIRHLGATTFVAFEPMVTMCPHEPKQISLTFPRSCLKKL